MTEKIKLTKQQAGTIENVKNMGFNQIMRKHTLGEWECRHGDVLNNLTSEQLAIALLVGYEVELTAEEELLKEYKKHCDFCHGEPHSLSGKFAAGIEFTLNILGIKIDGINK